MKVKRMPNYDLTERIWKMEGGRRKSWWWWFWLFFMENPRTPKNPRQLMILWSTKREKYILCNDYELHLNKEILRKGTECEFEGATASWFFDGRKLHEDFLVEQSRMVAKGGGERELLGASSTFRQEGKKFLVNIKGKGATANFIAQMLPGFPPAYRNHQFPLLGYEILKINRLKLGGELISGGKGEKIRGTAYFQKVKVDGPVIPWQWGVVHFRNGSYLSYNFGKLGQSLFTERHAPIDLTLRRKLEFYDAEKRRAYDFRNVKLERSAGRLPAWRIAAKSENGVALSATLRTYARALWRLGKSRLHPLNTLYYHEFCVAAEQFTLKAPGRQITLGEIGPGVGNCEDSKGMLI